jgi:hypothetical protein
MEKPFKKGGRPTLLHRRSIQPVLAEGKIRARWFATAKL